MSRCQSLSSTVCSGRRSPEPALLNSTSSRPVASATARTAARQRVAVAHVDRVRRYRRPPARRARAPSPSRSRTATVAPSAANRTAVARPIPDAPPVMIATCPSSSPTGGDAIGRRARYPCASERGHRAAGVRVGLRRGRRAGNDHRTERPLRAARAPRRRAAAPRRCTPRSSTVTWRTELVVAQRLVRRRSGRRAPTRRGRELALGRDRDLARRSEQPQPGAVGAHDVGRDLPRAARPRDRCRRAGRAARDRRRARPRTSTRSRRRV